jgi:peptidoglycan hydrolase-like protein with peptidoglycan-binding domain
MAKKSFNPLLLLGALGAGAAVLFSSKKSSAATDGGGSGAVTPPATLPATPAPSTSASSTVSAGGHSWKLVTVSVIGPATNVDVYAPAGSWGPHGELRVCRFTQVGASRLLSGVAQDVPKAVLDAALKDLSIKIPGAGATAPATTASTSTTSTRPAMPASLQAEMIATMMALGVDAGGVVRGPVSVAAIQHATELSSRLEQAGYPESATAMRGYAQQASKMLPAPATPPAPIPGVPAEMVAAIQRALQLERDPAKLEALKAALQQLPQSAQRDLLIGSLDALILQVRTAQAMSQAATEIDQMTSAAAAAATAAATPIATAATGQRLLKFVKPNMQGEDVRAWQLVLLAAGYNLGPDGADGIFGSLTDTATKDWQSKRGLTPDGDVGSETRGKIGTLPTAPMSVPSSASPRPDPAPKSSIEVNAEAVATHLRALQAKYGVAGSKGKQDVTMIKRFQSAVGGVADGFPGTGTMLALAKAGQGILPAVMYWPKAGTKAKDLPAYRKQLTDLAASARKQGMSTLASQLEASAARETGAGGLK